MIAGMFLSGEKLVAGGAGVAATGALAALIVLGSRELAHLDAALVGSPFATLPGDIAWYRIYVFGFPTIAFPHEGVVGFFIFHGLVWASLLVIAGVMLAFRRRMTDHGAAAVQLFAEDILPLLLLFAISVT